MELCRLAADRRDADRVLEQPARVRVVPVERRRTAAETSAHVLVGEEAPDRRLQAGVCDLAGKKLEEPVELACVASKSGGKRRGVGLVGSLERAHLELESVAVALDPAEDADRVALGEAGVEQLDIAPDARVDATTRVDELEREVGMARARAQPVLARDRVDALDDSVLDELDDRRHARSLGRGADGTLAPVAVVKPFRALRYDERRAGALADLVAPPYDVIPPEERQQYLARSPFNVVHLTLPESERHAARLFEAWKRDGVLVPEDEPGFWVLAQDYVGPDGVERRRTGLVASLRVEPYERGVVLPHERTHRGPKEGRLRLLRAVRAQLEPIFLLYDGEAPIEVPPTAPDLEAHGARLWRLPPDARIEDAFAARQLLIADGHHRYETALAFHQQEATPESGFIPVVLVSTRDPGLTIFPTHRIAGRAAEANGDLRVTPVSGGPDDALRRLHELTREHAAFVAYRDGRAALVEAPSETLDAAAVQRLALEDVRYTPRAEEAVAAVDRGAAQAAFLLRPPTLEQVAAVARAGDTMPQKSTYFYPKLLSGLLFHPV